MFSVWYIISTWYVEFTRCIVFQKKKKKKQTFRKLNVSISGEKVP